MKKRFLSFVLALATVAALAALCTACSFSTRPTTWSGKYKYDNAKKYTAGVKSFAAGAVTDLDIDWGAGTVLVEEDETVTEITLRETVYTGKSDDTPAVSEDEVLYHWLDGETLRVKFLRSKWGKQEVSAKILHVLLPTGKALGTVKIHSDTAHAEVSGITAQRVELTSASGPLAASYAKVTELDCESVSGNVSVYGTFGTARLKTTSGEAYACTSEEFSIDRLTIETVSGSVLCEGKEDRLAGETRINTVSGNVKLQFSHDMAYVIDFTTTSGVYESQFGTDETKTGSRYTVGTDGGHIAVSTTSGKVSVTRPIKKPHQE